MWHTIRIKLEKWNDQELPIVKEVNDKYIILSREMLRIPKERT